MTCCLPGVQSRKAITPIASKYPEDLQHLGYLHYMTRVLYLQKRTAVIAAISSCVTTPALMGQNVILLQPPQRVYGLQMCTDIVPDRARLRLQRCATFFHFHFVFATKRILHTFFFIDHGIMNKKGAG